MRTAGLVLLASVLLLVGYLLFWPIQAKPVYWDVSPDPGMTGVFAKNDVLKDLKLLPVGGTGPEDIAIGPQGKLYAGLDDGRVIRVDPATHQVSTFVNTGGRPLGLKFDRDGHLIIADGKRGLLSVNPDRMVFVLTDRVDDEPLIFVNELDIAGDGKIWFSDSTRRFPGDAVNEFMEGSATGRLLSYDPINGRTTLHLDGLRFANGVALGPNDEYVLVSETLGARITRLWLTGPKAGKREYFAHSLPGYPDNLALDDHGVLWVALPAKRATAMEKLSDNPVLRSMLLRVPWLFEMSARREPLAWIVGMGLDGRVLYNFQARQPRFHSTTGVFRHEGALYVSSIEGDSIARLDIRNIN